MLTSLVDQVSGEKIPYEVLSALERDLTTLMNRYHVENWCNMPDYLLAEYLVRAIELNAHAQNVNRVWHGHPPGEEDRARVYIRADQSIHFPEKT